MKSSTERSRETRERQKARARAAITAVAAPGSYIKGSFGEFVGDKHLDLYENLDAFGVFVAGSALDENVQEFETQLARDEPLTPLQRAEGIVDAFIDGARELSELINEFKLQEIERAIDAAIEASANLARGDVAAVKAAFAEIERLKAIRSDLQKSTRHVMPTIRARGE